MKSKTRDVGKDIMVILFCLLLLFLTFRIGMMFQIEKERQTSDVVAVEFDETEANKVVLNSLERVRQLCKCDDCISCDKRFGVKILEGETDG